jgi:tetratricopeptide (TPR) repeat protein
VRNPLFLTVLLLPLALLPARAADEAARALCRKELDNLQKRAVKHPEDANAWQEFRACAIELRRWTEAADAAQAVLEKLPDHADAHLLLGIAHFHVQEYRHALGEFQTAVTARPNDPLAHYYTGMTYLFLNQPADALPEGEKAAALDPKNPAVHRQLAYAYLLTNDQAKCEASAKQALALDPNDTASYKVLGNLYRKQGKESEANKMFEEAIHAGGRRAGRAAMPGVVAAPSAGPGAAAASSGAKRPSPRASDEDQVEPPENTPERIEHCKEQWDGMKEAVQRGDLETALRYYSDYAGTREEYRKAFQNMGVARVQAIFSNFGELENCEVVIMSATCKAKVRSPNGGERETSIRFERNPDKIWRIRSF